MEQKFWDNEAKYFVCEKKSVDPPHTGTNLIKTF